MLKTKFFTTLFIVLAVLFAQVGSVLAAPQAQEPTPIVGTIQLIEVQPGVNGGEPVVVVTVLDDMGATQTVRLSVDSAAGLDLLVTDLDTGSVVLDPDTGLPTADPAMLEQEISIDQSLILPDEVVDEEPFNPIAGLLASFFGTTNAEINQMHEAGFGFGLIAQALWIATDDAGNTDPALAAEILTAKQEKNFDDFFIAHPEYGLDPLSDETPSNWGQFRKLLRDKHENLGAAHNVDDTVTTEQEHGSGNGRGNNNGNGGGNNNGNGGGNGNGNGHGNND